MIMNISSALALASALAVTFAVFYNWAYFAVVDSRMFIHFSLSDHIGASLATLPIFAAASAVGVIMSLARGGEIARRSKQLEIIVFDSDNFSFGYEITPRNQLILIWGIFAAVVVIIPSSFIAISSLILPVTWTWQNCFSPLSRFLIQTNLRQYLLISYGASHLILAAIVFGLAAGMSSLSVDNGQYEASLKSGSTLEGLVMLRSTQNFILLRDPKAGRNYLLNKSEIIYLKSSSEYDKRSYSCKWTKICAIDDNIPLRITD